MLVSQNSPPSVTNIVSDWARYTIDKLQRSLVIKHVGKSGALSYSLLYFLKGIANADPSGVQLEFNYYGKFIDMGVGRGQKIEDVVSNRDVYSFGGGRRPKKWFSKIMYGEVAALRELLGQAYGQQGATMIRDTIQTLNP